MQKHSSNLCVQGVTNKIKSKTFSLLLLLFMISFFLSFTFLLFWTELSLLACDWVLGRDKKSLVRCSSCTTTTGRKNYPVMWGNSPTCSRGWLKPYRSGHRPRYSSSPCKLVVQLLSLDAPQSNGFSHLNSSWANCFLFNDKAGIFQGYLKVGFEVQR